jgi:copper chaperone
MPEPLSRCRGMNSNHQDSEVHTTILSVGGMSCDACVRHVTRALEGMTGIVHVDVRLREHQAIVEHLPTYVDALALIQAIRDAGYAARVNRTMADADCPEIREPELPSSCSCACCSPDTVASLDGERPQVQSNDGQGR